MKLCWSNNVISSYAILDTDYRVYFNLLIGIYVYFTYGIHVIVTYNLSESNIEF